MNENYEMSMDDQLLRMEALLTVLDGVHETMVNVEDFDEEEKQKAIDHLYIVSTDLHDVLDKMQTLLNEK